MRGGRERETARGAALRWRRHSNTDLQLLLRPTCSELLPAHKETAPATCAPAISPPELRLVLLLICCCLYIHLIYHHGR